MAPRYARMAIADPAAHAETLTRVRARLTPADRVLEIGCGTGAAALELAPAVARYTATDLAPGMIAIARDRPGAPAHLTFDVAGIEAAQTGPFDAILAFNLLHLLPDLPAALAGIHAGLRPGGQFLSKTPCLADLGPWLRLVVPLLQAVGLAPRLSWLTRAGLERAIAAAGFEVLETADLPARRAQRYVAARRPPA